MTKYLKLLLGLSVILLLANCSEDDTEDPVTADDIIGTWNMTALRAVTSTSVDFFGLPVSTTATSVGSNFDYNVTFTENTYSSEGGYDLETTVEVPGEDTQTETFEFRNLTTEGTYRFEDGTLIFDDQFLNAGNDELLTGLDIGEPEVTISFNGADEVTMTQRQDISVTDPTSGATFDVEIDLTTTLRRQ